MCSSLYIYVCKQPYVFGVFAKGHSAPQMAVYRENDGQPVGGNESDPAGLSQIMLKLEIAHVNCEAWFLLILALDVVEVLTNRRKNMFGYNHEAFILCFMFLSHKWIYFFGGFLSHRGTPSSPFIDGFSPTKTLQLLGYPHEATG